MDDNRAASIGKIGGYATSRRHDPGPRMARARAGLIAKYEAEVDPEGTLDPAERSRRAEALRLENLARASARSAFVRSRRRPS